jgi:YVTN family beta-propeller protein
MIVTVSVIDVENNTAKDALRVGFHPFEIIHNADNGNLYVVNEGSDTVSVIDMVTNMVVDTINVGDGPNNLVYNPNNDKIYVLNQGSDDVSVIGEAYMPIANSGLDQLVESNDLVHLDGSNSSDLNNSPLTYFWNQTSGPEVTLSDLTSPNPTFTAPQVNEQTDLTFKLTVSNEDGTTSEPDEVKITVNPIANPPPVEEEPRTISDIIRGIIQNPLDITNSIDSAKEIRDVLTDNDRDNDQLVCNLVDSEDESTSNIREILDC